MEGYGICRLNLMSVRGEPTHRSEQVTQLLFGDHYTVVENAHDAWVKIQVHFDGYEGWIDRRQHHAVSAEYYHYLNHAEFKITTEVTATLLYNKYPLMVLMGSIIPISSSELFRMEEQFAFNGEAKNLGQRRGFDFLHTVAAKYLHAPYQWGGRSPFGIDCSGFTQMIFKLAGYKLLRDAADQARQGREVAGLAEAQPGDLAFFHGESGKVTHVALVLADRRVIHAAGKVRIDTLTDEGIVHTETGRLTHPLHSLRRVMAE